ncbi:MAG: class I SAM-dependent methyltransferase, partial [Planctomycetes bacterium]|nr:class I SAM-dependent methyltransferase [Planctomycetota bacterium]
MTTIDRPAEPALRRAPTSTAATFPEATAPCGVGAVDRWRQAVVRCYDHLSKTGRISKTHYYHQRIRKRLATIVEPDSRVLEIGCGTGDLLAALRPACGVGVDLSERLVNMARTRHKSYRFVCMPGEDIHQLNDKFDYVVISQT